MRTGHAYFVLSLCAVLTVASPAARTTFVLKDKFVGNGFYDGFQWETFADPTHGRVNYVDQNTAKNNNLTEGARFTLLDVPYSSSRTP